MKWHIDKANQYKTEDKNKIIMKYHKPYKRDEGLF